jgi:transcriptional regulator with GAF, ATPase, and Fis domain
MSDPLSTQQTLDHETMWRAMGQLLDRVFGALGGDSVMDDCVDILVDILGADRGLILLTRTDGTTQVINARGHKKSLTTVEREEVSKTVIREARESGRCVVWDPLTGANQSESIAILGILAALAAPLHGSLGGDPRGVLYVDFRARHRFVEDRHVEFFMSAALLIGALLEQHDQNQAVREQLHEAKSHFTEARRTPPLADVLASPSLMPIKAEVESALSGDSPILILGESGTGKTLLAHALAEASGRRPIVRAVLGSSDDLNTITSELFGHERGSFSGATGKRIGLVEFASGGTLILDEILNLPPHAQQLLLDFTQFGTYRPLGHQRPEPKVAKVRIIAATNGDLPAAIRAGRFRQDLYYRLAAVTLDLPPLRHRREDIPTLAEQTLKRADPERRWTLAVALRRLLVSPALEWTGNVRQLERAVERARERAIARDPEATTLTPEHFEARDIDLPALTAIPGPEKGDPEAEAIGAQWQRLQAERTKIDRREQELLSHALKTSGGVVAHAARELGIARTTLSSRIDALGIRAPREGRDGRGGGSTPVS